MVANMAAVGSFENTKPITRLERLVLVFSKTKDIKNCAKISNIRQKSQNRYCCVALLNIKST